MQPIAAIPPYDPDEVKQLVGVRCRVPQRTNPSKHWWVEIAAVEFINEHCVCVLIEANHNKFGTPYWRALKDCWWRGQENDPLLLAMAKARAAARQNQASLGLHEP